jgi:PAS domain S-box-containing protein
VCSIPELFVVIAVIDSLAFALVAWWVVGAQRTLRETRIALGVALEREREAREHGAALAQQVARYRSFVENTDAIAFEYDVADAKLTYIAPQVTRLLGSTSNRSRREFLGTLIHPDDRERVMAEIRCYAETPSHDRRVLEYRLVRDDGRFVYLRTLLSDHGETGLIRGIAIDMTQQMKREAEVRQSQKLASVGRLAAGIAHEINTPMQYVRDSVEFVRDAVGDLFGTQERYRALARAVVAGTATPDRAADVMAEETRADVEYLIENVPAALDRALEGLGRVATIVRSLSVFAHPDQQKRKMADINVLVQNTLEIARHEYKYVADVELDLWELPLVECVSGEINQVLLNLIVNAAHAIAEVAGREERGLIRVRTRPGPGHVEIAIGDTGAGIPEALRERIFEPFFTTKPVGRGTGQGLALARAIIVDKHGGTIEFESTPGFGTTFTIRLPVAAASTASRKEA